MSSDLHYLVDLCIARLRKRLGWKDEICTVFRVGYRLEKEGYK